MDEESVLALQERLLTWSGAHGRQFPWRDTNDPYAILVAEKLLQQTAVGETVVRAYQLLLTRYPNPSALGQAEQADLAAIVAPLGLHYRARELRALGQAIVSVHKGIVPGALDSLLALPGVGDYVARAVLSYAFQQDIAVVDTNVARFLYRLYGFVSAVPPNPARSAKLRRLAQDLLPGGRARAYNLAVIDLCAIVCVPRTPHCAACPVREFCVVGCGLPCEMKQPQ